LYHREVSLIITKKTNTAIGSFPADRYADTLYKLGWFETYKNKKPKRNIEAKITIGFKIKSPL
jgi:hypothetical protein